MATNIVVRVVIELLPFPRCHGVVRGEAGVVTFDGPGRPVYLPRPVVQAPALDVPVHR